MYFAPVRSANGRQMGSHAKLVMNQLFLKLIEDMDWSTGVIKLPSTEWLNSCFYGWMRPETIVLWQTTTAPDVSCRVCEFRASCVVLRCYEAIVSTTAPIDALP
jgi:hypothetical protein